MNTGLCDHATVTDKYTVTQLEALAEFVHLGGKGGGVASVPGEGIHGDGATSMVAEQAVDDLGSVGAVVAGVAPSGEFAAGACEVAGRDIVEGDGTLFKVALGELAFNGRLPLDKPVHGVVMPNTPRNMPTTSTWRLSNGARLTQSTKSWARRPSCSS